MWISWKAHGNVHAVGGRAFAWCNSSSSSVQRGGNRENPLAQTHGAKE